MRSGSSAGRVHGHIHLVPLVVVVLLGMCAGSLAFPRALDYPVVDVHVHLSNLSLLQYSWNIPKLNYNWTCQNYTQATQDSVLPSSRIVFVEVACQPQSWLDEVVWVQSLAQAPSCGLSFLGIIGHAALQLSNISIVLDTMRARVPLLRGIRQGESCTNLGAPELRAGLRELFRRGLVFETVCPWQALPAIEQLALEFPEGTFVVDHLGSPDIYNASNHDSWLQALQSLAQHPNVYVKISGALSEAAHGDYGNWTVEELKPYVKETIKAFGHKRSMFAGNWFFINLAGTYVQWAAALQSILAADTSDKDWKHLLHDTAMHVYGVTL